MKKFLIILIIISFVVSCKKEKPLKPDIPIININTHRTSVTAATILCNVKFISNYLEKFELKLYNTISKTTNYFNLVRKPLYPRYYEEYRTTITINGLNPSSTYSAQIIYISNNDTTFGNIDFSKGDTIFGNSVSFTTLPESYTVSDIDSNKYHVVDIYSRTWLKENLKTTRFNNGDTISHIPETGKWANSSTPAYCSYNNDTSLSNIYGCLYNFYVSETDERNVCPVGWHVPFESDFRDLLEYNLYQNTTGGKLKEIGFEHWNSPNSGATNLTGFTALPGGCRNDNGYFDGLGREGYWRANFLTYNDVGYTWQDYVYMTLKYDTNKAEYKNNHYDGNSCFSIRCVQDK